MSERAYTVHEIDALRSAVRMRVSFGTTKLGHGPTIGRAFMGGERDKIVEEQVRTYILAGITAQSLYEEDSATNSTTKP